MTRKAWLTVCVALVGGMTLGLGLPKVLYGLDAADVVSGWFAVVLGAFIFVAGVVRVAQLVRERAASRAREGSDWTVL